jgi:hypothetical protein
MASGSWIPTHSSNVSAIRWTPIGTNYQNVSLTATEDILADRRLATTGPNVIDVGSGHGSPSVTVHGQIVDVRDTSRLRSLMTNAEWSAFQNHMLTAQPSRMPAIPVQTGGLRAIAPTARGKRITVDTPGILFVRFHDSRVYMYPAMTLGEALDAYQSPSKGKWVWQRLRLSGRVYQQISGPGVKFRVGQGR